jgi:hypothetical protein
VKRRDRTRLPGLTAFFGGWAALQETAVGDGALVADAVELDLPVEVDVWTHEGGEVTLGLSGPTQMVETTVMPVFHRLRCRIALNEPVNEGPAETAAERAAETVDERVAETVDERVAGTAVEPEARERLEVVGRGTPRGTAEGA